MSMFSGSEQKILRTQFLHIYMTLYEIFVNIPCLLLEGLDKGIEIFESNYQVTVHNSHRPTFHRRYQGQSFELSIHRAFESLFFPA